MIQSSDASWSELHQLFTIVMGLDDSMEIIHASETLIKYLPVVQTRPRLDDVFIVLRPSSLDTFEGATKNLGSLCLMTAKSGRFAVRGQLLRVRAGDKYILCFCGAPWLFWMNNNCPDVRLSMNDFSSQDVQLDQLFFMSTEKRMVEDLEQVNRDLLAAKKQLEEAQDAQNRFFAQMSHEIRTPLNGVVSALSLLDKCPTDCQQSQFVRLAQSSSHNLMQVINYVLDVSKLELSPKEDTVFSCLELACSTAEVVKARAEEKSLELTLDLSAHLPGACYGDPGRLRQTLLNLLINAIKFTDSGSVTLGVQCSPQHNGYQLIRFEVIDTGVGVANDDIQHIFEPFWSASPAGQVQTESGTGLGLDIVRRNVEHMGGEICVSSRPEGGTMFWFELSMKPCTAGEEARFLDEKRSDPAQEIQLDGRVLLVDDNATNLLLGSMILESLGLEVTPVDGGAKAVAAATQSHFDLVLMDIAMPDIDGLEATRQIRTFVNSETLPVVALTAHIDDEEKRTCLEVGMNGYLTKPIVKERLKKELATWLDSNKARQAEQPDEIIDEVSAASEHNIVDTSVLQDLIREIGRDNLRVVIDKVQTEVTKRWIELESTTAGGDITAMRRHVHSLASIFRSVGLIAIGNSLGSIESCLRSGNELAAGWLEDLAQLKVDSLRALDEQSDML